MRKKNSAFCYLYDSIVAQIAAGRFPYGASLPSASQLCGIYQVGLRTVRDVMPVLHRDGYIRTQERRRPVVVYRPAAPLSGTNFVRTLLERRSSISAAFEAMAVLMPPLLQANLLFEKLGRPRRSPPGPALMLSKNQTALDYPVFRNRQYCCRCGILSLRPKCRCPA